MLRQEDTHMHPSYASLAASKADCNLEVCMMGTNDQSSMLIPMLRTVLSAWEVSGLLTIIMVELAQNDGEMLMAA